MKFTVVCDSSADLPEQTAREMGVDVVPYYVSMDGETYRKEGKEIAIADFYQQMADHAECFPRTSMPSIEDYADAFRPYLEKGMPVLCICLTEKFSGSLQSARTARLELLEEFPDARIHVLDSQLVTALEGLFVKEAVRLRDLDMEMEEAVPLLEKIRSSGQIFFTTKDLKYLQHGGRLSKVASIAGSVLNLKPVLHFADGELSPAEVCRGRSRSLQKIADNFFRYLQQECIDLKGYWFGTGIGLELPEYEEFCQMLARRFDELGIHPDAWIRVRIGATIGVHTGPYPMGLGILKKCEV